MRNIVVCGRQRSSRRPTRASWSGDRRLSNSFIRIELDGCSGLLFPFVVVSKGFALYHRSRIGVQSARADNSENNLSLGRATEVDDDIRIFKDAYSPSLFYKSHSFLLCGRRFHRLKTSVEDKVIKDRPGD
ncbi:hypothetical protein R1flu_015412 [Riccia fluitans]|uniref:Uncharacterized protein n=1 Tax=Riccia fluitans TaxID=41844 RepID=A0ABD1YJC3_9MARC